MGQGHSGRCQLQIRGGGWTGETHVRITPSCVAEARAWVRFQGNSEDVTREGVRPTISLSLPPLFSLSLSPSVSPCLCLLSISLSFVSLCLSSLSPLLSLMSVMAASWVEETMPYQEAEEQREGHWKLWPGEECFWKEVGAGWSSNCLEDGGWVWAGGVLWRPWGGTWASRRVGAAWSGRSSGCA